MNIDLYSSVCQQYRTTQPFGWYAGGCGSRITKPGCRLAPHILWWIPVLHHDPRWRRKGTPRFSCFPIRRPDWPLRDAPFHRTTKAGPHHPSAPRFQGATLTHPIFIITSGRKNVCTPAGPLPSNEGRWKIPLCQDTRPKCGTYYLRLLARMTLTNTHYWQTQTRLYTMQEQRPSC